MKPQFQKMIDTLAANVADAVMIDDAKDQQLAAKDLQIASLQQQLIDTKKLLAPKVVTLANLQKTMPETLWYEARSPGSPKTGPHGTIEIVPGDILVANFKPTKLAGGESDNCYNLWRKYPELSTEEKLLLETATKFSIGCDWVLDPLNNVQAAELDFQTRKSDGTVINVGPQLLPDGKGGWSMRGFDFVNKGWVPLGVKASPKPGIPIRIEVQATCDGKTVQFTNILLDNVAFPVNYSHPTGVSKDQKGNVILNSPYINGAFQCDATGDAKAYGVKIGKMQITFA